MPFIDTLNRFSNLATVAQWNSNLRKTVNDGFPHKALTLFRQMKQSGTEPDHLTFPMIAKACAKLSNVRYSEIIHTHVLKSPFMFDVYVQTSMIDMYIKCDHLHLAHQLFDKMPERDAASWNVMIMGFAQLGLLDPTLNLFNRMRISGCETDTVTILGLTQSTSNAKNLNMLKAIHCLGLRIGSDMDVSVCNTWIAAYAKCNDLDSAEMVFDGILNRSRNVVSWNSMLAGYTHLKKFVETISFYRKMCRDGVKPDLSTIVSLLSSCVHPESLLQGKLIHCHGIQLGCDSDVSIGNTLISMYSKCGDIDAARYLFNSMCGRTCVSWTAMIGGYAENGDVDEAFALFHSMQVAGEKPDLVTLVSLLSACGQTGSLELGKWVNTYAISNGFGDSTIVCNALIDMYAKCGSMTDAQEIFLNMFQRSIISWTAMIAGYALNGKLKEALGLFSEMEAVGFKPNHFTFLAVLQACTHAGFLKEGWEYFNLMTRVYKLSPTLEHYACMADLLGRRGKIKEALEFIQNMPVEPDAGVWGALLSACKIYNETETGEYVAHHLFEMEPQSAVSYVAMANIYAAEGEWESVAKIRAMMKSNRVRKSPGQSILQVNGKIHAFTVEARSHSEGLLIYKVLDGLALQLKDGGQGSHQVCVLGYEWD